MGRRRDDTWFDDDVLWFGEHAAGHAASSAPRAPARLDPPPERSQDTDVANGLAESRRRRAEVRRRRSARRTRAAALVIGPAVLLSLAGGRFGGTSRAGEPLQEDPPSQTLRLGLGALQERGEPALRPLSGSPVEPERPGAAPPAGIDWRRATSHGLPYDGSLSAGTQLPVEGPDWVTWDPVEDRVPNRRGRLYGHERTIRAVVTVLAAHRAASPDAPPVVVGDVSFRGGGPMELHRSHQNGLDVDLYYPRLDRVLRPPARTDQIDRRLAQDLLDRFVAAGAEIVFVGYATGLRGPDGVVTPYPNHEDHMHVRFPQPPAGAR